MSIPWTIVTGPTAAEAITLAEARVVCHTDPDTAAEDTYLMKLIVTARLLVQKHTRRMLAPQTWSTTKSYWPKQRYISLPTAPVTAITGATYTTSLGIQTLAANQYELISYPNRLPILQLKDSTAWPAAVLISPGITITFTCGYTTIPEDLLEAMRSLIAYWYENREAAIASTQYKAEAAELPLRYRELIENYILKVT